MALITAMCDHVGWSRKNAEGLRRREKAVANALHRWDEEGAAAATLWRLPYDSNTGLKPSKKLNRTMFQEWLSRPK